MLWCSYNLPARSRVCDDCLDYEIKHGHIDHDAAQPHAHAVARAAAADSGDEAKTSASVAAERASESESDDSASTAASVDDEPTVEPLSDRPLFVEPPSHLGLPPRTHTPAGMCTPRRPGHAWSPCASLRVCVCVYVALLACRAGARETPSTSP